MSQHRDDVSNMGGVRNLKRPLSTAHVDLPEQGVSQRRRRELEEAASNPHAQALLQVLKQVKVKEKSVLSIEMKMLQQEKHYITACPYGNVHEGAQESCPAATRAQTVCRPHDLEQALALNVHFCSKFGSV